MEKRANVGDTTKMIGIEVSTNIKGSMVKPKIKHRMVHLKTSY